MAGDALAAHVASSESATPSWMEIISASALGISVVIRLLVTWRRPLGHDDFFWAYTSWLRSGDGIPNVDYYLPNFTPLEIAAPLFRAFPESLVPIHMARGIFFVVGVGLVLACYYLARTLGASVGWALAAANVFSWHHYIVQHLADIRADQLMSICFIMTLTIILSGRRAGAAGFAFGAAIALSYKIGVAGPWLLVAVVAMAKRNWLSVTIRFVAASTILPTLYFGTRIFLDGWPTFLAVWRDIFGAMGTGTSPRFAVFANSFWAGGLSWLFIFMGAIGLARPVAGDPQLTRRRHLFILLVLAFTATYVSLNPFIFPYNFVILMPLYAVSVVGVPQALRTTDRLSRLARPLIVIVPLTAALSGTPATLLSIRTTNEVQESVLQWLWHATEKQDAVFDWQGIHVGRPGVFHWWHYSGLQPKYLGGWYSVEKEIRQSQVKTVLVNYRLAWLSPADRKFIQTSFVAIDTCMLAPGWVLNGEDIRRGTVIEAFLNDATYRVQGGDDSGILINGRPIGQLERLRAGRHFITAVPGAAIPSRITIYYTTPKRERTTPPCLGGALIASNL